MAQLKHFALPLQGKLDQSGTIAEMFKATTPPPSALPPKAQPQLRNFAECLRWMPEQTTPAPIKTTPIKTAPKVAKPRTRRKGGGRKQLFNKEEIVALRSRYWQMLSKMPTISDTTAVTRLRSLVSKEKRGVYHLRSYQRHVFSPVREENAERQNKSSATK